MKIEGTKIDSEIEAKRVATNSYFKRMQLNVSATESVKDINIIKLGFDIADFTTKGEPLWEARIRTIEGELRAIIWINPKTEKIHFVIGPWKTSGDEKNKSDKEQIRIQTNRRYNQTENPDTQLVKTDRKLEKTKEAFAKAFDIPGNEAKMLWDLLEKADEQEKIWIRDMLIDRYKSEPDHTARRACVLYVTRFPEVAPKFLSNAMISDDNRGVRALAASFLDRRGTEQELDALFQAVKEDKGVDGPGRNIAKSAIASIGTIGGQKAVEYISQIWQNKELMRGGCEGTTVYAMGETGDSVFINILEDILKGDDDGTLSREAAARSLGRIVKRNPDKPQLAEKTIHLMRSYINDENIRVKISSITVLGWIGGREDIELLESFLNDENSTIAYYNQDGERKTRTKYPIREAAREAIDSINRRLPAEKTVPLLN